MKTEYPRVVFLDNVRTLVVLFVVVLHAACAYAQIIPWWPVQEFPKEPPYSLVILFFDLFCMPVLFFVAGYFAVHSLRRHGAAGFVAAKLRRLGAPLVLLGIFYVPLMSYVGYLRRTPDGWGFFDFWLFQLSTAWKPGFVLFDSPETALPHANDFSQWHLWFISMLLVFFLIYAAAARCCAGGEAGARAGEREAARGGEVLLSLLAAGCAAAVGIAASNMVVPNWAWAGVGGYLMFQPSRVGLYAALFCLGLLAARRRWFERGALPGPLWLWGVLAVASSLGFIAAARLLMAAPGHAPAGLALATGGLRALLALAWLVVLLKAAQRWWNAPRPVCADLARSSYDIFLLHLPLVVGLQLAATFLPVDFAVKFVLEFALGAALCWLLSRTLVRPHPTLAACALLLAFLTACLALR
ncbi:MAG: acyltransferase [Desulfovibrionaceae bacterium]|jgi:peptidoglycan/LPS O-acetylase OafA/YrhL|nr:acyltransferase [Desulfovibrionaceae bacterium]